MSAEPQQSHISPVVSEELTSAAQVDSEVEKRKSRTSPSVSPSPSPCHSPQTESEDPDKVQMWKWDSMDSQDLEETVRSSFSMEEEAEDIQEEEEQDALDRSFIHKMAKEVKSNIL